MWFLIPLGVLLFGGGALAFEHHKKLAAASAGIRGRLMPGSVVKTKHGGWRIDGRVETPAGALGGGTVVYTATGLQMQGTTVLPATTGKTGHVSPLEITEIVSSPNGIATGPISPTGAVMPAPTTKLLLGKTYALNVFTAPNLTSDDLWKLLTGSGTPFAPNPPKKVSPDGTIEVKSPALVKSNVTGTGYTFSPTTYDQWIAYVQVATNNDLPRLFGSGGSDVKGIIASAIDLTGALSSGDAYARRRR